MNKQTKTENSCRRESWSLDPVIDWLFKQGRLILDPADFVQQLAQQVQQAGAPIDRLTITYPTLNPLVRAVSAVWSASSNLTRLIFARHEVIISERYIGSPMEKIFNTMEVLHQPLNDLPDNAHLAFTELADSGFTDYFAIPIPFSNNQNSAFIIVTRNEEGFTDCDLGNLQRLSNYVAPILDAASLRQLSKSLMNTYVGKRTAEKVLSGMIKRGDADRIKAALWFSDLRDFTHLSETLPAEKVLKMLNDYFEFVSAAVASHGGEILRFIGDAMLIVFPINSKVSSESACEAALSAANDAVMTLAALNHRRRRNALAEIKFGVGLNVGEVIYGNVGAPDRLDFTVMGPAVNRTARLESLTKITGEDILVSKPFSEQVASPMRYLGEHAMKGISEPQMVYAPDIA